MSFQAKVEGEGRDLASLDVNDPLDFCYLPAKRSKRGNFMWFGLIEQQKQLLSCLSGEGAGESHGVQVSSHGNSKGGQERV